MDKINKQIQELLDQQSQNDYIGDRVNELEDKLEKLAIKEGAYLLRSEKELEDVKRLEKLGLKSLFNKVIGNLNEQIEKERQEYLLAVMKHKSIQEEIELLEYEKELLIKRYKKPGQLNEDLNKLVKKKEFMLKSHDTKFSKELFKKESELGRYKLLEQKANRVKQKAEEAQKILNQILRELNDVMDWPPSGKATLSSYAKKKYIDKARTKSVQAKVRLEEFIEISIKLYKEEPIKYDLSSFESFLDRFYNNLITDYVVKSQLERTISDVESTLNDLSRALNVIDEDIEKQNQLIVQGQNALKEFILQYGSKEE